MANGGADASQGEGWWQASDGKWYPPQTASPSIPPPPPPQTPSSPPVEDDGGDGSDKPPFWRRRWVLITGGILIVLIVITAYLRTSSRITATHDDDSNFVVLAWSADGRDLLVNDIGAYDGTVRIDPGAILIVVNADGAWTLTTDE